MSNPNYTNGHTFQITCDVKWAHVYEPDTAFGQSVWKVTCVLEPSLAKTLSGEGFNIRKDKDDDMILVPTRKTALASGSKMAPPTVVGRDNKPMSEKIGNGSKCNVEIFAKHTNPKDPKAVVAYLNGIQVVDLAEYNGGGFQAISGGTEDTNEVPF